MSELKKQTVSGVKWLVSSSFLQKAIQTGATIVLARILGPAEFGLFALAFVAIDALGLFKSMGFDSALIQRKENIEKAANTAFFIIPVLGFALYLVLAISAPLIGKFLNNTQVVPVIRALGIIFVISCLGKVPAALLEKSMQFKKVSIIEIGTAVIYSVSAIAFALLKFGVWSLVIAYILKTLYQNTLTFIYSKWRPKLEFDKPIAKEMFHFGKYLFLGGVVWFLKMNLDNMLVGKLLGVTALGLYAIAFNAANFGADYFGGRVYRVIFPAFSKIQNNSIVLRQAFWKTTKITAILAFPFCIGSYFFAEEIISLMYGVKWLRAVPIFKVLVFAGLFNTLPLAVGPLLNAIGKSKLGFWFCFIQVACFVLFIIPMARVFGLVGVAMVVAFSSLMAFLIFLPISMHYIQGKLYEFVDSLKPGVVLSLVMSVFIFIFRFMLLPYFRAHNVSFWAAFSVIMVVAFLLPIFYLYKFDRMALDEVKSFIK